MQQMVLNALQAEQVPALQTPKIVFVLVLKADLALDLSLAFLAHSLNTLQSLKRNRLRHLDQFLHQPRFAFRYSYYTSN